MKIKIKVKPNSNREELIKISEEEFIVYLKERAEKGEANVRLRNLLAKKFGVNAKQISIKNPKSKKKIIEIEGK